MAETNEIKFIGARISPELFKWVQDRVEDKTFGSQSHAIARGLILLKKEVEKDGQA